VCRFGAEELGGTAGWLDGGDGRPGNCMVFQDGDGAAELSGDGSGVISVSCGESGDGTGKRRPTLSERTGDPGLERLDPQTWRLRVPTGQLLWPEFIHAPTVCPWQEPALDFFLDVVGRQSKHTTLASGDQEALIVLFILERAIACNRTRLRDTCSS